MGLRTFSFDGISSDTFNLFISEAGPHGAPERAVEMLEIPGRNGFYALDQGRFNNTEVTYHVVVDGDDDADFSEEIADVREWLCSGTGYKRLEDDYNPNEYRMAVFRNGFDTDESFWNGAEFDITFDCKPQRWLKSGETATAVANNGTLTNPTLFDAEPLLEVKGYGGIEFNGYVLNVENVVLGDIIIADSNESQDVPIAYTIAQGIANIDDEIDYNLTFSDIVRYKNMGDSITGTTTPSCTNSDFEASIDENNVITTATGQFNIGTNKTDSNTVTGSITWKKGGVSWTTAYTISQTIQYNASGGTITITSVGTYVDSRTSETYDVRNRQITNVYIVCHSTVFALGNPTYIDCEIGEAYMYNGGNIVSSNSAVALGSDLPKLASGTNTITFDNTVTELKIRPRWWRV